jgi:hypothetical protein
VVRPVVLRGALMSDRSASDYWIREDVRVSRDGWKVIERRKW